MPRRLPLVILTMLLLLAACGQAAAPVPTAAPAAAEAPAAPTVAPGSGGVDVTDSAGRSVIIPAPPQRIVSLAPSTTEILFALGLGARVVAVDDMSNYPPEAASLPKIGGYGTINFEQIAALTPDLVLAAGITPPEQVQTIADLGVPVVVVGQAEASVASVYDDITLVGRATGAADVAERVVGEMRARIERLTAELAGRESPTVYWELDATDAAKPYTVGPGSFVNELITLAGGKNIFDTGDNPYPQVSAEQVVAASPQVILLANAQYGMTVEQVAGRPGWDTIDAVKNSQIHPVDADLTTRPGPRLPEGLETIARLLHPEIVR